MIEQLSQIVFSQNSLWIIISDRNEFKLMLSISQSENWYFLKQKNLKTNVSNDKMQNFLG